MPSLIVGSTPRGDDYFGQDDLIHTLWSRAAKAILGLLSRSGRSVRRDTLYQRFLKPAIGRHALKLRTTFSASSSRPERPA